MHKAVKPIEREKGLRCTWLLNTAEKELAGGLHATREGSEKCWRQNALKTKALLLIAALVPSYMAKSK